MSANTPNPDHPEDVLPHPSEPAVEASSPPSPDSTEETASAASSDAAEREPIRPAIFLIALCLVWGVEIGASIVITVILVMSDPRTSPMDGFATGFGVSLLAVSFCISTIATVVASWFVACRSRGLGWINGLRVGSVRARAIPIGALIGVLIAFLNVFLLGKWSTGESFMAELVEAPGGLLFITFCALAAPFSEEIYYRGLIFSFLRERTAGLVAFGATVGWFTIAHAAQLLGDPIALVGILIAALTFTGMRLKTGFLLPAIACHFAYNATLVIAQWLSVE